VRGLTPAPETRAAIAAARVAGRILMAQLGRPRAVRLKSPVDPVTAADRAAERAIRQLLGRRFPRIGFVGEEGTNVRGPDGRWIVDPLDGTIAFIAGLPSFGVSIALEREGRLAAAVVWLPRLGELLVAERGRGTTLNGRPVRVTRTADLARCVVSLWQDQRTWRDARLRARVARIGRRVRSVRSVGAVFSLAYVAAGRLDGYWERSAHVWDVAAGALLVREAGGRVTDVDGAPVELPWPAIVASNGRIHGDLVAALSRRRAMARGRRHPVGWETP
jgi:myo-inositol-1(or 4)-monophosphatase